VYFQESIHPEHINNLCSQAFGGGEGPYRTLFGASARVFLDFFVKHELQGVSVQTLAGNSLRRKQKRALNFYKRMGGTVPVPGLGPEVEWGNKPRPTGIWSGSTRSAKSVDAEPAPENAPAAEDEDDFGGGSSDEDSDVENARGGPDGDGVGEGASDDDGGDGEVDSTEGATVDGREGTGADNGEESGTGGNGSGVGGNDEDEDDNDNDNGGDKDADEYFDALADSLKLGNFSACDHVIVKTHRLTRTRFSFYRRHVDGVYGAPPKPQRAKIRLARFRGGGWVSIHRLSLSLFLSFLSLFLSFSLSFSLSLYIYIYLYLSLCIFIFLSLYLSISMYRFISLSPSISPSFGCLSLAIFPSSLYVCIYIYVCV
jgi:hypothetical protein